MEKASILGLRVASRRSGALHSREDSNCEVEFDRVDGRYGRPGAQTAPSTRQSETTPTPSTQRRHMEMILGDDPNTKGDRVARCSRRSDDHK